jgi:hypothetical protein
MPELRLASRETLKGTLKAREGYKYDQADRLIDQAEYLFNLRICDEEVFRNLIPCTWVIRDGEAPRTLDAIAARVQREFGGLDRLIEVHPCHEREWYERLRTLYQNFLWERMGPVFVTPVKGRRRNGVSEGEELGGTPTASFMIVSGLHCSLAATLRMNDGEEAFRPVEAVLVLPRLDY